MNSIIKMFKKEEIIFSQEPQLNDKDLVELPVDSLVEFKGRMLKVVSIKESYTCQGCAINEYYVSAKQSICDGLACFKAIRGDGHNAQLHLTSEKLTNKIKGGGQQELAL